MPQTRDRSVSDSSNTQLLKPCKFQIVPELLQVQWSPRRSSTFSFPNWTWMHISSIESILVSQPTLSTAALGGKLVWTMTHRSLMQGDQNPKINLLTFAQLKCKEKKLAKDQTGLSSFGTPRILFRPSRFTYRTDSMERKLVSIRSEALERGFLTWTAAVVDMFELGFQLSAIKMVDGKIAKPWSRGHPLSCCS